MKWCRSIRIKLAAAMCAIMALALCLHTVIGQTSFGMVVVALPVTLLIAALVWLATAPLILRSWT